MENVVECMESKKILYIYRHPSLGISITKVYKTIEKELKNSCNVDSIVMPGEDYSIKNLIKNIRYTQNMLKNNKYDIVHITGAEHYLIPFIKKENVVVTVHDFGFYTRKQKNVKLALNKMLWIDSLRLAKRVICISNKTKDEAIELAGVEKEKISVVYDPVGKEFCKKEKTFDEDCPIYLHVGTRPHKNLENTILALRDLPHKLRIIGRLSEEQKRMLQENGIDYSNAYDISDEEIKTEYENCDIVSFISLHEGFGMIIIEGQAVGRVVVTSDIQPMIEVADNSAILVNPTDVESIKKGFQKAVHEHEKYIELGLENVKRFDVTRVTRNIIDIYVSVLNITD